MSRTISLILALMILAAPATAQMAGSQTSSHLTLMNIHTGERKVIYDSPVLIEAPNWSRDGRFLIYNSLGHLYKIPAQGGVPAMIDTEDKVRLNNDHGLSPDGASIAISDQTQDGSSRVYVLPAKGGQPREVTPAAPSYWHGWSPDGQTLAFVGLRDGDFDIYSVPVNGGPETRLTEAEGLDDGPDYDRDGNIWFNSVRTGHMQIYRMKPDGSKETRMTNDPGFNDWFPHPSPDNKWVLFLSFNGDVEGHPPGQNVRLRVMPLDGSAPPRDVVTLYGGQGTLNVNSWSPDSAWFAYVSYDAP